MVELLNTEVLTAMLLVKTILSLGYWISVLFKDVVK